MSVNYYWKMDLIPTTWTNPLGETVVLAPDLNDPRIHVCQYAAGRFSWAQDPEKVLAYCRAHMDEVVIVDEKGIEYTGVDFLAEVKGERWETDLIGQWFC